VDEATVATAEIEPADTFEAAESCSTIAVTPRRP
jgi:hypothetical protein